MRARVFVMAAFVSLACLLWPLFAARAEGQSGDAELKKFQGTWVMVSAEMDGRKVKDTHVKLSRITFVGDKVELIAPHQHKDRIFASVVKVDEAKNPKEMQWVRSSGPNAGITMTAIYEFEGPDKYKICFDPAGSAAPKKFGTTAGSSHIWQTWKRVKR